MNNMSVQLIDYNGNMLRKNHSGIIPVVGCNVYFSDDKAIKRSGKVVSITVDLDDGTTAVFIKLKRKHRVK